VGVRFRKPELKPRLSVLCPRIAAVAEIASETSPRFSFPSRSRAVLCLKIVANAKIQSQAADQKWRQGVLIKPSPKLWPKAAAQPSWGLLMMIKGFGDWMLDVGDWGLGFQNKEYWPRRKQ